MGHFIAAYWQSVAAFTIREQIREDGETLEEVAQATATSADTLARKLRGEVPAKLRDLGMWVEKYGVDLMPYLDSRSDLFPDGLSPEPPPES